jgi:hypothetical protein
MLISFDGTVDHDIVPAGGFVLYDFAANDVRNNNVDFFMSTGTQIWVKQVTAPASGNVYVVSVYNKVQT